MRERDMLKDIRTIAAECGGTVSVAVRSIENAVDVAVADDAIVSAASVIKLPLLVEALRHVREGGLSLDAEFALADEQRVRGSGVARYLHEGIVLTLKDLLTLMMIVSDNTATNLVIDLVGMDSVNATMREMGYPKTRLQRKMMDWPAIEQGRDNLTTAREMADLLVRIARNGALGKEWDATVLDILRAQQDSSKLGLLLPEVAKLANKTGGRQGFMHDCGIVTGPEFSYAICVFTGGAKSAGDAHLAIGRISRAVYDRISGTREG